MDMEIRGHRAEIVAARITFQHAQESFLLRCRAQNLSLLTIGWYKGILGAFGCFLEAHGIDSPRDATPNLIRSHLDQRRVSGHKSCTIVGIYGALRCFFSFLARERMIPASPMSLIEKPRKERRFIQALNLDQARILLAQPNHDTYAGLCSWTIMLLILDSGLRVSEVLNLRRDQVNFQANSLRVMGKGGKEREVSFGSAAKQALWRYASKMGTITGQERFFVDQFGRALNARWLQERIRAYGKTAKIEGVRVSPHTLRHTFATQYILNGGDAFSLQKILGHNTLDMVRIYVDLADREVALQHRKYSPVDHMGVFAGERGRVVLRFGVKENP